MLRRFCTALLALLLSLTFGCMGKFALTRALLGFNNSITNNGVINHVIFWALVFVLPIYELAVLGDLFILNVIEFWTGKNLLAEARVGDDGRTVRLSSNGETFTATQVDERTVVVTAAPAEGASGAARVLGSVEELDDGAILMRDGNGDEVFVVGADEVKLVARALWQR